MSFNNMINRTDAEALIPQEVSREIIQAVPQGSIVMRLARRLQNMAAKQKKVPVLSALAMAYFVQGDTGLKQTTKLAWEGKIIEAEELAVIVPIPESVLSDAEYDIWGEVRPSLIEAFGQAFDRAVLFGDSRPATWPQGILQSATAAGHAVTAGSDLYADLLGQNWVMSLVERDGYPVTAHVAGLGVKARLRNVRDAQGRPILIEPAQTMAQWYLAGAPIEFPTNGAIDETRALLFAGDWAQVVYAIRQDITYKVLDQAVITDNSGAIIYNLAQQDMVALRATMRIGWQIANPVTRANTNAATRFPFAVLLP